MISKGPGQPSTLAFYFQVLEKKGKKTCNEISSEKNHPSLKIHTKTYRRHSSYLKQTTEDGISIWLHSSLHNKVPITLYLNRQNKTSEFKIQKLSLQRGSGNVHEVCTTKQNIVFTIVLFKPKLHKMIRKMLVLPDLKIALFLIVFSH